jgi:hypothetical protein
MVKCLYESLFNSLRKALFLNFLFEVNTMFSTVIIRKALLKLNVDFDPMVIKADKRLLRKKRVKGDPAG